MSIGYSDIWVGRGVHQGWVGTILPKVLLRWMPSRLSPLVVAAVSAAAAAAAAAAADDDDDDDGGGGGNDDDDDNNDNGDNYDDDDHAFLGLCVAPDRPSTAKTLTDDCSALYWTQELGLTCLESGRRAASNEPSCFSRR